MDYTSFIFDNPPRDVDRPIFIDIDYPNRSLSWTEYAQSVKKAAIGLQSIGVAEQDCVALISPNEIYIGVLADAIVAAGAIFAGIPAAATHREILGHCAAARIGWLFAAEQNFDKALAAAKEAGIPSRQVLLFDPPGLHESPKTKEHGALSFSNLLQNHSEEKYVNPNSGKDLRVHLAARCFTSGTTGTPKAADISHAAHVARAASKFAGANAKHLHYIGMHHVSGISSCQRAASGQNQMFITRSHDLAQIVDMVPQHGITSIWLPPRAMIAVTDIIDKGVRSKDSIRSLVALVGGSQIPNEALDAFQGLSARPIIGYGSTEAGSMSQGEWPGNQSGKAPGYVGSVVRDAKIKIINPDTLEECGFDSEGEICVNSPFLFSGYCGNEKATQEAHITDAGGERYFRTGDKGKVNADRELWVIGRYKEVFKVGTVEVAPAEIELTLTKHPAVKDAAIVATKDRDDQRYYEVKAYVVTHEDQQVEAQELVDFVATNLTAQKAPTGGVSFVAEIPRNAMHKVVTRALSDENRLPGSKDYLRIGTGVKST